MTAKQIRAELRYMARKAEERRPTRERGLTHFTVTPATWRELGEPSHVRMSNRQLVPIYPTGRKPNWFRWVYRKRTR